jgi:hypothetical protein
MKHKNPKAKVYLVKAKTQLGIKRELILSSPNRGEVQKIINGFLDGTWEVKSIKRIRHAGAMVLSDKILSKVPELHKSEETMGRDPRIMGDSY